LLPCLSISSPYCSWPEKPSFTNLRSVTAQQHTLAYHSRTHSCGCARHSCLHGQVRYLTTAWPSRLWKRSRANS
jgi:hypothetical protein